VGVQVTLAARIAIEWDIVVLTYCGLAAQYGYPVVDDEFDTSEVKIAISTSFKCLSGT
jgi:hypothetical protein